MFYRKSISGLQADLKLVERFLAKEKKAEDDLYNLVYHLLEKNLAGLEKKGSCFKDPDNVRDEIAAAILADHNAAIIKNYKGESRLTTYLWSIIRYKLIDKLRNELTHNLQFEDLEESHCTKSFYLSNELMSNELMSNELMSLIEKFIAKNAASEAFILKSKWLENFDYKAITKLGANKGFKITQNKIGNLLFKKRIELTFFLERHGYKIDIQKNSIAKQITHKYKHKHEKLLFS